MGQTWQFGMPKKGSPGFSLRRNEALRPKPLDVGYIELIIQALDDFFQNHRFTRLGSSFDLKITQTR